jgi:hypothetical protein
LITYVNKDNSRKYRILYDKAYNALVDAKKNNHEALVDLDDIIYIDSLEQYFYYLPYLM